MSCNVPDLTLDEINWKTLVDFHLSRNNKMTTTKIFP